MSQAELFYFLHISTNSKNIVRQILFSVSLMPPTVFKAILLITIFQIVVSKQDEAQVSFTLSLTYKQKIKNVYICRGLWEVWGCDCVCMHVSIHCIATMNKYDSFSYTEQCAERCYFYCSLILSQSHTSV